MKRLLTILCFIIGAISANAQQKYKPSLHAGPQNKPSGISSATPLDSRAYFYDTTTHAYRPYANRGEVLSYLYLASYRSGQFTIIIDSISNKWAYWFRNGTADSNLVLQYNFAAATTDSSVFATLYRVDTAKVNLRNSIAGKISTTLPTGQILAGNLSNVATPVTPGGVLTMTSGGSFDYVANSITYAKLQAIPGRSVFGNPTGSTANSRATYMGYGTLFDNDTLKVDTAILKSVFGGGGGGGNTNSNIGSGYRWAVPGTNNVKTVFGGYAFNWDSTSNTNALTGTVDSAVLANYFLRRKDSTLYATVTAISGKLSNTLASQHMFVGNGSNVAVDAGSKLRFNSVNSVLLLDSINMVGSITQNLPGGRLRYINTAQGFASYTEAIDQSYTNFNGIKDVVWTRGWNVDGGGGRLNDTVSAYAFADESLFNSGLGYQNEHYFYGISRTGVYHRYLAWNADDTTGKAYAYTEWDALQMFSTNAAGTVEALPYAAFGPAGGVFQGIHDIPTSVQLLNPYHVSTYGNLLLQTQTDGSTNITNDNGKIDLNTVTVEITGAGAYPLIINQGDFYNGKGIYIVGHVTGPSYPIHIATASDADQYLYNQNTGTGNAVAQMWSNTANVGYILSNGGSFHWTMGSKHVGEDFTISSNTGYFNAGEKFLIQRTGNIGIGGNITPTVGLATSDTGAWKIPSGLATQRPVGDTAYFRENRDSANYAAGYEGWNEGRNRYERFAMKPYVDSLFASGGGGGGTIPPNLGSAYRVYAPQTPGFKTLSPGYGMLIDSATTGQLGLKVDSATLYSYVRSITGSDSLKLRKYGTGQGLLFGSGDTLNHKALRNATTLSDSSLLVNTLENADQTPSVNRTIAMSSHNLIISGTTTNLMFKNNSVSTVNYGINVSNAAPHYFALGWTSSAGAFTRGVGLYVDTFNNVYTSTTSVSYPGYANGSNFYVGGNQITAQAEYPHFIYITGNTTLDANTHIVYVDATSGSITVTLPSVSTVSNLSSNQGQGVIYTIKRIDASINTVTISPNGSDTIDLTSSLALTSLLSRTIQAAGSGKWFVQ